MAARGRASAAAIETPAILAGRRPPPPAELNKAQAAEWKAVVDRMPADWFTRETHAMLSQYVRHVDMAAKLGEALGNFPVADLLTDAGVERFDKLTKLHEREGRAMSSLATRLRLTQQSRYNPAAANTAAKNAGKSAKKPWEE